MRPKRKVVLIVFAGVILLLLAFFLEPFKPRYEGRTARRWLSFYSATRRLPERAVVTHFGASAIPMLLQESRPSGLYTATLALERLVRSRAFDELRTDDFDRRLACNDWARILLDVDPQAYTRALTEKTNIAHGLELTRLFYGDRHLGPTLKLYSAQTTNRMLAARAGQLLDAYRALN